MFVDPKRRLMYLAGVIPGVLVVYFVTKWEMDRGVPPAAWAGSPAEEWPQLVLTNEAKFDDLTRLNGYSACLVEIDGDVVAVTARSHLDRIGGIENLSSTLESWTMYPEGALDRKVTVKGLRGAPSDYAGIYFDCVLLDLEPPLDGWPSAPLRIRRGMPPRPGAMIYVVTSPRGWSQAAQKVHEAHVVESFRGVLHGRTVKDVKLGMSLGAPVVNAEGNLEGILVGEREDATGEPGAFVAHSLMVVLKQLD